MYGLSPVIFYPIVGSSSLCFIICLRCMWRRRYMCAKKLKKEPDMGIVTIKVDDIKECEEEPLGINGSSDDFKEWEEEPMGSVSDDFEWKEDPLGSVNEWKEEPLGISDDGKDCEEESLGSDDPIQTKLRGKYVDMLIEEYMIYYPELTRCQINKKYNNFRNKKDIRKLRDDIVII